MKRVLITGGAGFIGSHLANLLTKNGYKVRVLDNLEPQAHGETNVPAHLASEVEFQRGSVLDSGTVHTALEDVDAVFHFAAMVGVGQSQYQIARYTETNIQGTAILLDALANQRHRVRKLVVASSMSVYGEGLYRRPSNGVPVVPLPRSEARLIAGDFEARDPETGEPLEPLPTPEEKPLHCESIYALNKRDQEEYCLLFGRTYGLPVTACRFFNVYGPQQSMNNPYTGVVAIFMSRIKNGSPPRVYEDGLQSRDFIHVGDIARACLMVMEDPRADGRVFNVGTGQRTTILDLARILEDLAGSDLEPEVTGQYRKGDVRHCFADITRIRSLGFSPQVSLYQGMKELYAWAQGVQAIDLLQMAQDELESRGLILGA